MAQESWMRIIKNASQYRPVGQLSAWICQVTRNVCLNELRGQKWEESFEDVESELPGTDDPAAVFEQMSERKELEKAFAELAPQQRAVFVLFVFEEMSHAEIAKELSLSVNAVKQLIFRAKERLRREPR